MAKPQRQPSPLIPPQPEITESLERPTIMALERSLLIAGSAIQLVMNAAVSSISPYFPTYAGAAYGLTPLESGVIMAAMPAAGVVFSAPLAALSSRVGRVSMLYVLHHPAAVAAGSLSTPSGCCRRTTHTVHSLRLLSPLRLTLHSLPLSLSPGTAAYCRSPSGASAGRSRRRRYSFLRQGSCWASGARPNGSPSRPF